MSQATAGRREERGEGSERIAWLLEMRVAEQRAEVSASTMKMSVGALSLRFGGGLWRRRTRVDRGGWGCRRMWLPAEKAPAVRAVCGVVCVMAHACGACSACVHISLFARGRPMHSLAAN
eukprot:5816656-Prymnesium_polylepis.1